MLLSAEEIRKNMKDLKHWQVKKSESLIKDARFTKQDALYKDFVFVNFLDAMGFLNNVAKIAEMQEHHPDFLLYNWNKVSIWITTHSESGLTQWDFDLAKAIEKIK